MNLSPELVLDCRCELGEGPIWHDDKVWWVDIDMRRIHSFDPVLRAHQEFVVPYMTSLLVPRETAGFIVATERGIGYWDDNHQRLDLHTPPDTVHADLLFNDGKCDPMGRLLAGTKHRQSKPGLGTLYAIESDYCLRPAVTGVGISNGLAWTKDGLTLYYVDSLTRRVDAFDYDLDSGRLANRRPAIILPDTLPGIPDGMEIDSEGRLWVAIWEGHCVVYCDPENGEILERVELPVSKPTSCCFGGLNLNELYVTSARAGIGQSQLEREPNAGGLFRLNVPVKGYPVRKFKNIR